MRQEPDASADTPSQDDGDLASNQEVTEVLKEVKTQIKTDDDEAVDKAEVISGYKQLDAASEGVEKSMAEVDKIFNSLESLSDLVVAHESYGHEFVNPHYRRASMTALESIIFTTVQPEVVTEWIALEAESDAAVAAKLFGRMVWKTVRGTLRTLIELLKQLFAKLREMVRQMIAVSSIQKRRAKALQGRLRAMRATADVPDPVIENEAIAMALYKETDLVSVNADVSQLRYIAEGIYGEIAEWARNLGNQIADYLNNANLIEKQIPPPVLQPRIPNGDSFDVPDPGVFGLTVSKSIKVVRSNELLGKTYILTKLPRNEDYSQDILKLAETYSEVGTELYQGSIDVSDVKASLRVLSLIEINQILENVGQTLMLVDNYDRAGYVISDIEKRIIKGTKKVEEELDQLNEGTHKDFVIFAQRCAMAAPRIVEQPALSFSRYYLNLTRNLLDYVEASLDRYPQ